MPNAIKSSSQTSKVSDLVDGLPSIERDNHNILDTKELSEINFITSLSNYILVST
jgi:hypothetical protein